MNRSGLKEMYITFLTAFELIIYEVFLSRFFAAILDYNFAFLAVSLATLGIGLGGFWAYRSVGNIYRFRNEGLGIFSIITLMTVSAMYLIPFIGIWFYSAVALLPFFAGGSLLASIMQGQHDRIRNIYFADLAGAGLGAVSSIWLMNAFNPMQTIGLVSATLFLFSFLLSISKATNGMKVVLMIILPVVIVNIIKPLSEAFPFRAYETSPHNIFSTEEDAEVVSSEWNSLSRTDVYDAGDGQLLYITVDGGAVSPISKYEGDLKQVDYLRSTTSFLAFSSVSKGEALIIGAGGGQEVLGAQMAGFNQIEAVDINSGSFRAVQVLSPFSGNIYNQPNVKSIISDGRNYIRHTRDLYDLIYLSLVKKESQNGLGLALTENYIFTEEAVGEYMQKLKPDGRLAFLLHDETELAKVKVAAEKSLYSLGIADDQVKNHIVVIGTFQHLGHMVWGMKGTTITRPLLIVGAQPFSMQSAQRLKAEAESIQQVLLHVPYVFDRFNSLTNTLNSLQVNVSTNQDDKPYFYWNKNGVPQSFIWMIASILLIIMILIRRTRYTYGRAFYFSGIAIGFILIEIILVQRLILPLGHPTYSFVLVLGVLLVSGGVGSFMSKSWFPFHSKRYVPLLWVTVLTIGINAIITWYNEQLFYLPLVTRMVAVGILLIPLGFFMGMPFPYGLAQIPKHETATSWAINGLMTVVGSLISILLSITFGFTVALIIGASLYGLLFILQPKLHLRSVNR